MRTKNTIGPVFRKGVIPMKTFRKAICLLLAVTMIFPMLSVPAAADDGTVSSAAFIETADTLNTGTWDSCNVTIEGKELYSYAYEMLELVNEERTANGIDPLVMDVSMLKHAMVRAAEIALYFSHTRPNGLDCTEGCDIVFFHENIAAGRSYSTPQRAFDAWKSSSGHYKNIMNTTLKTIGVGVFYVDGNYYWVQDFSRNSSTQAHESDYADHQTSMTLSVAHWLLDDYATAKLSGSSLTPGQTASFSVRYTLYPAFDLPASGLVYESSDESVCTVSEDGTVTAVGGGTATVSAWYPGYEDGAWTFTVTVSVPAHDCDYTGTMTTEPGCETAGVMTYLCSICRKSYTEEIAPTGHTMSQEGVVTLEPGCLNFGKLTYSCQNCDYTETQLIAPNGHNYDTGEVTVMPTESEDGTIVYTCLACGETNKEALAFLLGDVKPDGRINTADLVCLMKLILGADNSGNPSAADVTGDGTIDILDVVRLARHLADSSIILG